MTRLLLIAVMLSFGCGLVYGCWESPAEKHSSETYTRLEYPLGEFPTPVGPGECKSYWVPNEDGLSECLFEVKNGDRIEVKIMGCRSLGRIEI